MGADDRTGTGDVVYLLAELQSERRGPVHEIGSRARVLEAYGDRVTLAVGSGAHAEIITCARGLVGSRRRVVAARRPFGYPTLRPAG
jgi:hypothetical protein